MEESMQIGLTRGGIAIVDKKWHEMLSLIKWQFGHAGYAHTTTTKWVKGRGDVQVRESMHRVIMSAKKGQMVDHKNGNTLDNRECNLRFCTKRQNIFNSKPPKRGSSNYKGVRKQPNGTWRSYIKDDNNKVISIGKFQSEIEAAKAYDECAIKLRGEFAWLNFPETRGGA